ncbi:nitrous oxide reductase accessory protein NosL [Chitinophaga caseinilytica]|uniref:Nitrous oxide reductase accessory protein NosL n=1 Tax=Chitinophaga caseinilytica TaxID=2267521 RepID=A0ABZ2ZB83_9BACT
MKLYLPALTLLLFLASACGRKYEPIAYGKDACAHCKMTIMDKRFSAEIVNPKGRVFKFDDIACLRGFDIEPGSLLFVNDYSGKAAGPLLAEKAVFLHHESFKSPMAGNFPAFADEAAATALKDSLGLDFLTWEKLP